MENEATFNPRINKADLNLYELGNIKHFVALEMQKQTLRAFAKSL